MVESAWAVGGCVALLALGLGGCASSRIDTPSLAALPSGDPVPVVATPALEPAPAPAPVVYGAFLEGPVGSRLPEADRAAALQAADGAIASGERRTWKGAKGVFGYVVPGSPSPAAATVAGTPGECRAFTSTIFFAGRPQTGHGIGCRGVDGTWHVTS